MTPLEVVSYAVSALLVSPVVLLLIAAALFLVFACALFVWESRLAKIAIGAGLFVWLGVAPLARWVVAPRPPKTPESCASRCDNNWEKERVICLTHCYQAEKLIKENEPNGK